MTTINVQFTDSTKTAIQTAFASPQDADVYENLGTVDSGDAVYSTWYQSLPLNVQGFWPKPEAK